MNILKRKSKKQTKQRSYKLEKKLIFPKHKTNRLLIQKAFEIMAPLPLRACDMPKAVNVIGCQIATEAFLAAGSARGACSMSPCARTHPHTHTHTHTDIYSSCVTSRRRQESRARRRKPPPLQAAGACAHGVWDPSSRARRPPPLAVCVCL